MTIQRLIAGVSTIFLALAVATPLEAGRKQRNVPPLNEDPIQLFYRGNTLLRQGEYEAARNAYLHCEEVSENDDMLCATLYWLYLTDRRMGEHHDARNVLHAVNVDMNIIENFAYHKLLLLYKGKMTIEEVLEGEGTDGVQSATQAYGIANYHLNRGDVVKALAMMNDIIRGDSWAAFGAIGAEADLARVRGTIIGATEAMTTTR